MQSRVLKSTWQLVMAALVLTACTIPSVESPSEEMLQVEPVVTLPKASAAEARTVESAPIEGNLPFSQRAWKTDFTKRTVDYSEIRSGGPPKDGIPSLDQPTFESIEDAADGLRNQIL